MKRARLSSKYLLLKEISKQHVRAGVHRLHEHLTLSNFERHKRSGNLLISPFSGDRANNHLQVIVCKLQEYVRYSNTGLVRKRRELFARQKLLLLAVALLFALAAEYLTLSSLDNQSVDSAESSYLEPNAPIPGVAYTLLELQCRSWNRYRGDAYCGSDNVKNEFVKIGGGM